MNQRLCPKGHSLQTLVNPGIGARLDGEALPERRENNNHCPTCQRICPKALSCDQGHEVFVVGESGIGWSEQGSVPVTPFMVKCRTCQKLFNVEDLVSEQPE